MLSSARKMIKITNAKKYLFFINNRCLIQAKNLIINIINYNFIFIDIYTLPLLFYYYLYYQISIHISYLTLILFPNKMCIC